MAKSMKMLYLILFAAVVIITFPFFLKFPDVDIRILGIGWHRFFLFHSAAFPLMLYLPVRKMKMESVIGICISGGSMSLSGGVGIHLFSDVPQTKAVMVVKRMWGSWQGTRPD